MAWQGRSVGLGWCDGQPLTASARDDMGEARVGTKKRLSDRTKKLMKDKGTPACRNSLTNKAPYKAQAAPTARPKVLMRRRGADCSVVVMKRGNARGAKGVGHRHWLGSTGNGRNPMINGRRQPSRGGTSRMN